MYLMNKDIAVLWFDDLDYSVKVLNNSMLPFALRDDISSTEDCKTAKEIAKNYDKLRHFFADRVLSISRDNAKSILQSIQNKQHLTEEESYKLSLKCRGVSINDSFWVKEDDEVLYFSDINIRNRKLSDVTFQISIKGTPASIQHSLIDADVSSRGMFRKTWMREEDGLYLYKSDSTSTKVNTKAEIKVSEYLDAIGATHVNYEAVEYDGEFCCKSKCFTNDDVSFVEAEYVQDYLSRHDIQLLNYVKDNFLIEFTNMVVCDYLFGNPDEHIHNWGFMVDVKTNEIISLAPIFDNNQALVIFELGKEKEFDELIYEPTGKTMLESFKEFYPYSNLRLTNLPEFFIQRLKNVLQASQLEQLNMFE